MQIFNFFAVNHQQVVVIARISADQHRSINELLIQHRTIKIAHNHSFEQREDDDETDDSAT